jgi:hypothetical protein
LAKTGIYNRSSFIFLALCLAPAVLTAQNLEMFEYTKHETGYIAVPKFDKAKPSGIEGRAVWSEEKYIHDLFNRTVGSALSRKKREQLHLGSSVMIAFDIRGEVINCKFFLAFEDKGILTEEELYAVYMKFKKVRINPYKVRIENNPEAEPGVPGFAVISGPLVSKEGREKRIKETERDRYLSK